MFFKDKNGTVADRVATPTKRPATEPVRPDSDCLDHFQLKWESGIGSSTFYYLLTRKTRLTSKFPVTIHAFDLDYTIVRTKSGMLHAQNSKDWNWLYPIVPKMLKQKSDSGVFIFLVTNQAGIDSKFTNLGDIQEKIEELIHICGVPFMTFICTGVNHYRKPSPDSWNVLLKSCFDESVTVDWKNSCYVGDAAGRPKDHHVGCKKDFSCADRKYAANLKLAFYTPEEYFLGEEPTQFDWYGTHPSVFLEEKRDSIDFDQLCSSSVAQEMVIMVGMPASGKTAFVKRYFLPNNYIWINRDQLKTQAKCLSKTKEQLDLQKSLVIDNTNSSMLARAAFIQLAAERKIRVRCFIMDVCKELCVHQNYLRQFITKSDVRRIPEVAYNVYKKNYDEPTAAEGFDDIVKVPFVPAFHDDSARESFLLWSH